MRILVDVYKYGQSKEVRATLEYYVWDIVTSHRMWH